MSNIDRKLIGVEKLFNEVLPTIYPHITNIKISKNDTDGYRYPEYDLISNKGYITAKHKEAIVKYGLQTFHRKSYQIKL